MLSVQDVCYIVLTTGQSTPGPGSNNFWVSLSHCQWSLDWPRPWCSETGAWTSSCCRSSKSVSSAEQSLAGRTAYAWPRPSCDRSRSSTESKAFTAHNVTTNEHNNQTVKQTVDKLFHYRYVNCELLRNSHSELTSIWGLGNGRKRNGRREGKVTERLSLVRNLGCSH